MIARNIAAHVVRNDLALEAMRPVKVPGVLVDCVVVESSSGAPLLAVAWIDLSH